MFPRGYHHHQLLKQRFLLTWTLGVVMEEPLPNEGILLGKPGKRQASKTKDRNAEAFWLDLADITAVCRLKANHSNWGPSKILDSLSPSKVTAQKAKKYLERFFYDLEEGQVFLRSSEKNVPHRRCVTKDQLTALIRSEHQKDHRSAETLYESLRVSFYPVVRESVLVLFRAHVNCPSCARHAKIPKTTLQRKTIRATYPNSRWQVDLKKMPKVRSFEYIVNIVDCFSRFAFGTALKSKTASEVCQAIVEKGFYVYGSPRILQSDNGKEFNNASLTDVLQEMKAMKINGRPYHPQSQGRVERFNQTVTNFFRRDLLGEKDWPSRLPYFYASYNNRVHSATKPHTPYELFFRRPNFSVCEEQIPLHRLTEEERQFLEAAHLDVDAESDGSPSDGEEGEEADLLVRGEERDSQQGDTAAAACSVNCGENTRQSSPGAVENTRRSSPGAAENTSRSSPGAAASSSVDFDQREGEVDLEALYPVEAAQGTSSEPDYQVGDRVYFYKPPNLGGKGVSALMASWELGRVSALVAQEGGFRLFAVTDTDGYAAGNFSKSQLQPEMRVD